MDIIKSIEHEQLKSKIPDLKVGNTVKVHARIKEGNKERIQVFEGIIIKVQGAGVNKTFTVRKISYGVGVEKTFLIHSPLVEKVEVVRIGKARRAKLFYLRDRIGKAAKTKEQLGARIENKEIVVKGEEIEVPVEGEVEEVVPVAEETVATETTVAEETTTTEAPVSEATETATVEETPVETAPVEEKEEVAPAEEAKVEENTEAPVEDKKADTTEE